jgi:hypothetical protein
MPWRLLRLWQLTAKTRVWLRDRYIEDRSYDLTLMIEKHQQCIQWMRVALNNYNNNNNNNNNIQILNLSGAPE